MHPVTFAAVGECMIELSGSDGDLWRMGYAGDTFNAAWYARAILPEAEPVSYVTALGDDPFSAEMQAFIGNAGIDTDRIRIVPGKRPGLYAIALKGAERTFTYWRGEAAARQLADDSTWLAGALSGAKLLYFSGITLAILSPEAREKLLAALAAQRAEGARIAFDPNFRPALWPDRKAAQGAMEAALRISDVALPTFDDEARLFGDLSPKATLRRIGVLGPSEIVVKNGADPCLLSAEGTELTIPAAWPERVVDTTGAGDSFAGTYLAARLTGEPPEQAARMAHKVAAEVIGVHGALAKIDRDKIKVVETLGV